VVVYFVMVVLACAAVGVVWAVMNRPWQTREWPANWVWTLSALGAMWFAGWSLVLVGALFVLKEVGDGSTSVPPRGPVQPRPLVPEPSTTTTIPTTLPLETTTTFRSFPTSTSPPTPTTASTVPPETTVSLLPTLPITSHRRPPRPPGARDSSSCRSRLCRAETDKKV
jgi:hypothetical protein